MLMHAYIAAAGLLLACNSGSGGPSSAPEVRAPARAKAHQSKSVSDAVPEPRLAHALSVATFNINFGNVDLPSISQTIAETDADFVFLQETNKESQTHLQKSLQGRYPHAHFSDSSRRWSAGGFGFLSKYPFEEPTFTPATHGLFGTFITEMTLGEQVIRMINLHLSPIRVGRARTLTDVFSALQTMEEVHTKEAALLVDMFDSKEATIGAGDLNSISSHVAPWLLVENGLPDAVAATVDSPNDEHTWQWPVAGQDISFRIDYIFHSSHFQASSSETIQSEASDHELVVAELSWK
jgi:endonuclease/exonuclease/phosphatase family metal-dependent hydrolase